MAGLLPRFITDRIPLFGGASDSGNENSHSSSEADNSGSKGQGANNQSAPKNLNELVDRVMDNSNIDNRTKREILTVILNNIQHQPSIPTSLSSSGSNDNVSSRNMPVIGHTNGPFAVPVLPNYLQQQPPMFYPQQPTMFYSQQQAQPQYYPMTVAPNMYYPPQPQYYPMAMTPNNMYYPPAAAPQFNNQPTGQIEVLTSKVNEISGEIAELIKMMKGELEPSANNRSVNMDRIRDMINKLSATNSSNQPIPVISDSSETSEPATSEPETLSDLPSKSSGVNSVVDTVGSAINSINTALGLNSEATSSNKSKSEQPSTETEQKPEGLSEEDKKLLADEAAAKSANNTIKPPTPTPDETVPGDKTDNMVDLDQYKPQNKIDETIDEKSIDEGLNNVIASPANNTGAVPITQSTNKPANNTGAANNTRAINKPANNTGAINKPANNTGAINKPSNNTGAINKPANNTGAINKPANNTGAINKPANNTGAINKPANNLAAAIGNLNKTVADQEETKPVEQQQLVGGGYNLIGFKTIKKKSRGMLSSVADVLGLTSTTQKKQKPAPGGKRGRPRKN